MASPALPFVQTKATLSGASSQTAGASAARAAAAVATAGDILRLDDDELRRGLGRLQRLGDDERHRLADGTDAVADEHRTSGLMRLLAVRAPQVHPTGEVRQPVGSQVLAV